MVHVESEGYRPKFEQSECLGCTDCLAVCPSARLNADDATLMPKRSTADHEFGPVLEIWEGAASDPELRFRGSSGGVLSAISLFALESGGFDGVLHAGMDPDRPWLNRNYISRTREAILARSGSRYSPSAPCAGLLELDNIEGTYVFIGKPCDAAAVSGLRKQNLRVSDKIGLVLTFFCAGTPSTEGTLSLLKSLDVSTKELKTLRYRGEGWPGEFKATVAGDPDVTHRLTYETSWGALTSYRPLRCNLCPDGLGRIADIACGDAWDQYGQSKDPGRSLVLVRTEKGRQVLRAASRAGYVTLNAAQPAAVLAAQPNLLARRKMLLGRLLALQMLGVPTPDYHGFSLLRSWMTIGLRQQVRTLVGTLHRGLQRGWYRKTNASTRTDGEECVMSTIVDSPVAAAKQIGCN